MVQQPANASRRPAQVQAAIEQARQTPGKEVFDLKRFLQLYDPSLDVGAGPVSAVQADRYEEEYYLLAKHVKTLQEFADYRRELALNDAN